jgi:hypothetical protein
MPISEPASRLIQLVDATFAPSSYASNLSLALLSRW